MARIIVDNIPDDLYARLKNSAEANRRSLNSEIIIRLEHALKSHSITADEVIARARMLREHTNKYTISDAELKSAKAEGRL